MEKQPARRRFYQGNQLVTQVLGPNASQTLLLAGGRCLSERQGAGNQQNKGLVATESKGSVIDVVHSDSMTRHMYTPYGYGPAVSAMFPSPGFTGAMLESVTGCYMLGNGTRGYNPRMMRFSSSDRLSPFLNGGLNSYAYCEGDPVNYSDPTGQMRNRAPNRAQQSVALAKKRLWGPVRRKYEKARDAARVASKQRRERYLNAYEDAPPILQSLAANAQTVHDQAFQEVGHFPSRDPLRSQRMELAYPRTFALYDGASDPDIRQRFRAVLGRIIKEAAGQSNEARKSFLEFNLAASKKAHEENDLARRAQMLRAGVNELAYPIAALTPPASPAP